MATVLIADDEPSIRQLVAITLEEADHLVVEAANGQEALDHIMENPPDLAILDVMMPEMDGWAVLRELRQSGLRQQIRVVMLTAKAAENDFVTGWKLGVDAYVTKPFDPEDLITTVNETLMMTPEQLKARRTEELEKANLLSRLESAFDDRF
jgi:DNA-binding response OmpR family regulator